MKLTLTHLTKFLNMLQCIIVTSALVFVIFAGIKFLSLYIKSAYGICKCSRQMVGKVVLLTGAHSGIGYATAKDLAERGARVIFTSNDDRLGNEAKNSIIRESGNRDVHYYNLELSSSESIRTLTDTILKTETRLDVLVNNAGVFFSSNIKTKDGLLAGLQINYFGPFLLTYLLLPILKKADSSRIINVASIFYGNKIDLEDLMLETYKFSSTNVYMMSKMYIIIMTIELARRLASTNITVNCLHPGIVTTNIIDHVRMYEAIRGHDFFTRYFLKSPWEGAQTSIYLSVSPEVQNTSGRYFIDCVEEDTALELRDENLGQILWDKTMKILNLSS